LIGVDVDSYIGRGLLTKAQDCAEKQKRKDENSLGHEVDCNRRAVPKPGLYTGEITKRRGRALTK
jgi:hypothetical protein